MSQSKRLVDTLVERMQSMESSIMLSRKNLVELQEAHHAKSAPLQLCKWRLERRAGRPKRELKRDNFEIALDQEKEVLEDAQRKLKDSIRKTDNMIQTLVKGHDDLKHDLQVKSHALDIDADCVGAAHTWGHSTAHPPLEDPATDCVHQLPVAILYENRHQEQEHRRQYDTVKRIAKAKKCEQVAQALRDESCNVMKTTASACATAQMHVQRKMLDNINELNHMRQRLNQAIAQSNQKIQQTTGCLQVTAGEIASHNHPMNLTNTRLKLRGQRPERENIADPVKDALDQQMSSLQRNLENLEQRHVDEKTALQRLQHEKAELEADLADKTKALYIDVECQKKAENVMSSFQSPEATKKAMKHTLLSLGTTYPLTKGRPAEMPNLGSSGKARMSMTARGALSAR
jgi:hypothetical protein